MYKESRALFKNPDVITDKETLQKTIQFVKPDEEGLKSFLINEKGFTKEKSKVGLKN